MTQSVTYTIPNFNFFNRKKIVWTFKLASYQFNRFTCQRNNRSVQMSESTYSVQSASENKHYLKPIHTNLQKKLHMYVLLVKQLYLIRFSIQINLCKQQTCFSTTKLNRATKELNETVDDRSQILFLKDIHPPFLLSTKPRLSQRPYSIPVRKSSYTLQTPSPPLQLPESITQLNQQLKNSLSMNRWIKSGCK